MEPKAKRLVFSTIVVLVFIIICCVSWVAFDYFTGINYFSWYARSGPLIALAVAALGMVFGGFDEDPGFISRHPGEFLGSYMQVAGVIIQSAGATVKSDVKNKSVVDSLLSAILGLVLTVCICAWLLLIVPLQYFLFCICGALSRRALEQQAETAFHKDSRGVVREIEVGERKKFDKVWLDNGLRKRPYSLTSGFTAGLLYAYAAIFL